MAKPSKDNKTTVRRIKATDDTPTSKTKTTAKAIKPKTQATASEPVNVRKVKNPFAGIIRYFKGAWYELRQVRWPDRRTTWGMTGALLAFTGVLTIFILLLDAGFAKLFNLLLGK